MNCGTLKTLQGIINLLQVLCGFAAIFACSVIWSKKNLAFQLIYDGYGWQTVILLFLIFTWLIAIKICYSSVFGKEHVVDRIGKPKMVIVYVVCLLLLTFAAAMESWYISVVSQDTDWFATTILKPRFITVTVFNWIMVAGYLILIGLTMFCS